VELFGCGYFISWFIGWLVGYLVDWLISRSVCLSVGLSVSRSANLSVDRPISLLVGQLVSLSASRSVSRSVCRSVGRPCCPCPSVLSVVLSFGRTGTRLVDSFISYRCGDASTYNLMNVDICASLFRQCCFAIFRWIWRKSLTLISHFDHKEP